MIRIVDFLSKDIHSKKVCVTLFLCILFFVFLDIDNKEMLLIACYSGMFVIQQSSQRILIDASRRLVGTCLSGGVALVLFVFLQKYHLISHPWYLLAIPLIILFCSQTIGGYEKNKAGVMSVCLTTVNMLVIVNPSTEIVYLFERLFATILGSVIAFLVNLWFHHLMKKREARIH